MGPVSLVLMTNSAVHTTFHLIMTDSARYLIVDNELDRTTNLMYVIFYNAYIYVILDIHSNQHNYIHTHTEKKRYIINTTKLICFWKL